ncbi:ATP-grasp domain-containing protein [Campylobacter jejuni]|uniref:ATP-grasp domain-containing protein n=3 Tax=Campylobacter TaxID=194 RepID=A0A5T0Q0W8_CAMJU|nr:MULTISPECIES: ATP-grasp domain-containing protein [unclassified Campylobacter]EAI8344891.1 ATP-grasp domain-containing protein [Campylobacter jejuni]TEY42418.1 ATP-grasp domain-containing protein [Campylobacter sp. CH185]EAJ0232763.1 ATP-grasp domain-containing protein [Campylobacter jejuni]EAK1948488.1 ATP-grasp domain-containing protein [Campylobacter jejuni]EAL4058136.1 ATP-grasp domain-containing protein [Campylobacter jejuni]
MKNKHFFIIGGGDLQADLVLHAKKDFITHVFDYNENCFCKDLADYFHPISIADKEKILELAIKFNIVGIATAATELGNLTVCYIGEKLNLGTNSYECAKNTTDKSLMKKVFERNNINHAKYFILKDEKDLEQIANFPVVVKPSDRSAGRGVVKVFDKENLKKYFYKAKDFSYNKIVLAEEVLKGRQFSVEAISSHGKHQIIAITEEYLREGEFANDFLETQHLIPARITHHEKKIIQNEIIKVLNAFKINFGASHIEIKLHNNIVKIIEIASRMGGWRDVLVYHSYGIDYLQLLIQSSLKQELKKINTKAENFCLVKMIFTKEDYLFYKKIKSLYPEFLIKEKIHFNNIENFDYSSSLMDSKGYYYIKMKLNEDINVFLLNKI